MRTKSAKLATLFLAALGVAIGVLFLDLVTAADHSEPATVLDGRYYPPGGQIPDGVWLIVVRTEGGEVVTAVRPKGLPGLRVGDSVSLVTHRGVIGLTPRRAVR